MLLKGKEIKIRKDLEKGKVILYINDIAIMAKNEYAEMEKLVKETYKFNIPQLQKLYADYMANM